VQKITILHTNDLHSRLNGYSPESAYTPLTVNDDNTTGGFARIATIIKEEQERADGTLLVLDGGDFLMGTLFQGLEEKTGFQLRLMKRMGYDVACLGNHEFDYGPAKLSSIVTNSARKGEIPGLLLSNIVFDEKDFNDDSLEALFAKKIIGDKIVVMRDGLKIGFFSLLGKVADDNAAYATPVTFSKQIPFARKMVDELKKEKCDLIICLSHSGVLKNSEGEWDGEDVDLAKRVRGIDLIISGHTHSKLIEPVIVNGTPIVQTGEYGQFVGKLSLSFSNGNVSVSDYSLIPVDDRIPGDPLIHRLIEEQEEVVTSEILKPLGLDSDTPVAEAEFLLECNEQGDIEGSNLGPMVADAIHHYVNRHRKEGTDISMVAVGVIRDKIVPGLQTAPDIFKIMSMGSGNDDTPGYPLATLYVTGRELKHILEILQIAYKSTPGNYCYYSGVKVGYDPDKMIFKKIKKIEVIHPNGTTSFVDFSKRNKTLYSITANSYMLEFIGIIKKMSFGLINVTPKDSDGNRVREMRNAIIDTDINRQGVQEGKEWLALLELLASMKDNNGNGIPEIDRKYSIPIKSFFLLK
jgi:5'-nucleotidase